MFEYLGFIAELSLDFENNVIKGKVVNLFNRTITFQGYTVFDAYLNFIDEVEVFIDWLDEECPPYILCQDVEDKFYTMEYKGFVADICIDVKGGVIFGLTFSEDYDVITFESKFVDGVYQAFVNAVEEFLADDN